MLEATEETKRNNTKKNAIETKTPKYQGKNSPKVLGQSVTPRNSKRLEKTVLLTDKVDESEAEPESAKQIIEKENSKIRTRRNEKSLRIKTPHLPRTKPKKTALKKIIRKAKSPSIISTCKSQGTHSEKQDGAADTPKKEQSSEKIKSITLSRRALLPAGVGKTPRPCRLTALHEAAK
jgi:hypothetical protein